MFAVQVFSQSFMSQFLLLYNAVPLYFASSFSFFLYWYWLPFCNIVRFYSLIFEYYLIFNCDWLYLSADLLGTPGGISVTHTHSHPHAHTQTHTDTQTQAYLLVTILSWLHGAPRDGKTRSLSAW